MTTTNPIPLPIVKLEQPPELTNFQMRIDPAQRDGDRTMATLIVLKGEQQIFSVGMPIEEMRRILHHLLEGVASHMEGG